MRKKNEKNRMQIKFLDGGSYITKKRVGISNNNILKIQKKTRKIQKIKIDLMKILEGI